MIGFRIAAQTRCFAQSIKKALHTAASLGCDGVQIDVRSELKPSELSETGVRQFRKILNDLNLRVGSVTFPTRRGYSNPVDLQPRIEATLAAMQFASRIEARIMVANLGPLSDAEDGTVTSTLTDAIETLAAHADRLGVRLAMQSPSQAGELAEFVAHLPEGAMSLDFHPGQLISRGESPAEFISTAGQHIAHVHASDGVYDLAAKHAIEVDLGRGTADFPELLGLLEEFGYRDWLTIERRNAQQPLEAVGNAVSYLRSL